MNQQQLTNSKKDACNHGVAAGIKLEIIKPVLWHIRYTTAPARLKKVALPLMLESKPPHMTTNKLNKGSTMTDKNQENALTARVTSLETEIDLLGKALTKLTGQHQALLECVVMAIMKPDQVKNAPTLSATMLYDNVSEAIDETTRPDSYMKAVRAEINEFFERVMEYKQAVQ